IKKRSDDQSCVIDTRGRCRLSAGHVEGREASAGINKAMPSCAVDKCTGNLALVVDAAGRRLSSAGYVNGDKSAPAVTDETVLRNSTGVRSISNDRSRIIDPVGHCNGGAGSVKDLEGATRIQKALYSSWTDEKDPNNLPRVVDPVRIRSSCKAGYVY